MIWTLFWWFIVVPGLAMTGLSIVLAPLFGIALLISQAHDKREARLAQEVWDRKHPPISAAAPSSARSRLVPSARG